MTRQNKKFTDAFNEFDDMSELVDAFIDRVDLVGKAANGHSFILAKSDSTNMLPADLVRDLIAKANEEIMPETTEEVAKADLDANTILADTEVSGNADEIGSAAWEAVDAATAAKWAAILGRAMTAICELRDREKMERDELGEDNDDKIDGLHDAVEAIEFAISVLAPFAVHEAAESDEASGDLMKSEDALETLEKAGRSLSTANETALRAASEAIQKVLDSLPAPAKEEVVAEDAVAKKSRSEEIVDMAIEEIEKSDDVESEVEAEVEVEKSDDKDDVEIAVPVDEVTKAVDAEMSDSELARIALTGSDTDRMAALQEIGLRALTSNMGHEASETPAEEVAEEADEEAEVADDVAEIEDMPVEDEAITEELTPAPADEVGTPAGEVTKAHKLKKSVKAKKVEKLVKEARDEESEKYLAIIKSLEDRVATLEAPAPSRVLTNGALPPAHLMRGQDAGASLMSDATALRKQMDDAPDAVTKSDAQEQMRLAALDALSALRNR